MWEIPHFFLMLIRVLDNLSLLGSLRCLLNNSISKPANLCNCVAA